MSTPTSWWDALGKPVPPERRQAAYDLLIGQGCGAIETELVLGVVAREIEHDEPDRAQKYLRHWLPAHGSETLVLMVLATLAAPEVAA